MKIDLPKKQLFLGVLYTSILVLLVAILVVGSSSPDQSDSLYGDDTRYGWADSEDDSWRNGVHDGTFGNVSTSTARLDETVQNGVLVIENDGNKDLLTANGLAMELKRLVRAGRSMEALRTSSDPAQRRRCSEGTQKLTKQVNSIRSRRKNIAIPSGSPVSLSSVLNNILKCVSCAGDARLACDVAQTDLDLVARSLSVN